jgi:hypothetical protein
VSGDRAVALDLVRDQLRLDRRRHRLGFGEAQPQTGWGDPVVTVDGRDVVLNRLSRLNFRHQLDRPAHRASSRRGTSPRLRIPR